MSHSVFLETNRKIHYDLITSLYIRLDANANVQIIKTHW